MGIQKIILVGSSDIIPHFIAQFNRDVHHYLQISGYCSDREVSQVNIPFLGITRELDTIIQTVKPEGILLAFNAHDHDKILDILSTLEGKNIEILFVPDIFDMITSHTGILEISGMPVYRLKSTPLSGWQGLTKRVFDFMVSVIGLFLLSPLFLIIAVLVKLGSKGPVFYKQNRIGLDGREFNMLKFRSMIGEAEKNTGPVWAKKNDPRVTTIGRFLRRTSLDELPQLINVLKGEMSLVGPRPERKKFVYEFQQYIPKYTERHRVRSGVTGWAQVNGLRGQSPIEKRTQYDVYYIENWSLWFDIKIILMTFMAIIRGENAY
jgi:exopolysaccharide biosynthesis polyprenyl glycosylphosphotransferase